MGKRDYCGDAEWWIRCGALALGERGVSGAQLEMLKNGISSTGGVPNTDLYSDKQLGWGGEEGKPPPEGEVARARRCAAVWYRLSANAHQVLLGRYDARQWPPGVTGRLGDLAGIVVVLVGSKRARDRIRLAEAAIAAERKKAPWSEAMAELDASTQPYLIPSDWDCVVRSCQSAKTGERERAKQRGQWLREAGEALASAHAEWKDVEQVLAREWVA